jgi:hypothetical protein
MAKFNLVSWIRHGLSSWWSYWRESLNAGQETHDFMLYTLVTILIIVATILTLSGVAIPDLDLSDPTPHIALVVFELTLITWILLYLPYKRHKAEEKEHEAEKKKILETHIEQLSAKNNQIKGLEDKLADKADRKLNKDILGRYLDTLERRIRAIEQMDYWDYDRDCIKEGIDEESQNLAGAIKGFIAKNIGDGEAAAFASLAGISLKQIETPWPHGADMRKKMAEKQSMIDHLEHWAIHLKDLIKSYD